MLAAAAALAASGCAAAHGAGAVISQPPPPAALNGSSPAPAAAASALRRAQILPLVAHHQHLMSPSNLADIRSRSTMLPAVDLPPELDRLLRDHEALFGSSAANDLFTEDAQILRVQQGDWVRGKALRDYLTIAAKGLRYRPSAWSVNGSVGWIAGTMQLGEPRADVGNFMIGLRKGADGKWRIGAESISSKPPPDFPAAITADTLIAEMDEAGVQRGVVLSVAFWWASAGRTVPVPDEYARVRAENDWTVAEVARFPGRLVAFCGVNPLRDYALAELERCASIPQVRGMKLHFANSGVDVKNPQHAEEIRRFFAAANARRLAVLVHLPTRDFGAYGAEHSRIFVEQILPAAPDIAVQIAHLAGSGPAYGPDEALAVFAEGLASGDPRLRNVYIDVAGMVTEKQSDETSALIVRRMRQIGLDRILFGSDGRPNPPPAAAWTTFRKKLPLTDAELQRIATNVAPYLR